MSRKGTCPPGVRRLVRERSQGRCEVCGQQMEVMDAHRRKQGSVRGKYTPANVVGCHRLCHSKVHDRIKWAMGLGLILRSTDRPVLMPVRLFDGWFLLDDQGGMTPYQEGSVA